MKFRGISRHDWTRRWLKLAASLWRIALYRTTFIVITGSMGKTTAKEMAAKILSSRGRTLATPASDNGAEHVARTILRARPWHRYVVLEAGTSGPGWIKRIASISRPDIAVILNVGRTHTDQFPTLEDTAKEKQALLTGLRRHGVAILNDDDRFVSAMADGRKFGVVRFGLTDRADVLASDISSIWPDRLSLTIRRGRDSQRVETRLVGSHWACSVLAAATVGLECGVSLPQIAAAVATVKPTPGRLDPRELPSGAVILRDDFNGSLQTFQAAFRVLRDARAPRKILAITTVGDSPEGWDKRLRSLVSEAISACGAVVLVGADDDTKRAAKTAVAAGFPAACFYRFEELSEAADFLRTFLQAGDLALLRGRTTDHMGRLYYAQTGQVSCWIKYCPKREICERCPKLYLAPMLARIEPASLRPAARAASR